MTEERQSELGRVAGETPDRQREVVIGEQVAEPYYSRPSTQFSSEFTDAKVNKFSIAGILKRQTIDTINSYAETRPVLSVEP